MMAPWTKFQEERLQERRDETSMSAYRMKRTTEKVDEQKDSDGENKD